MLANYEIYQGIYEISETINGQPSWIKDNRAIWYTEANSWVIGGLQYIGSLSCRMYTYPSSGGLTDELNDWKYYDGQGNSLRSIGNKTHGEELLQSVSDYIFSNYCGCTPRGVRDVKRPKFF